MTHRLNNILSLLATLLLTALAVLGCGCTQKTTLTEEPVDENQKIYLTLTVKANTPSMRTESRADDYYYHPAYNKYEQLHTLDAIVVNASGIVEGRGSVTYDETGKLQQPDGLTFQVKEGKKTVYLFANEASMPTVETALSTYYKGAYLNAEVVDKLTLSREAQAAFFDNQTNVPMSEKFEVDVNKSEAVADPDNGALIVEKEMFVTRIPTKFTVRLSKNTMDAGTDSKLWIRLDNQALTEYVLPYNATYKPGKNEPEQNVAPGSGRDIERFTTPANASASEIFEKELTGATNVTDKQTNEELVRYDSFYLMESPGNEFKLSVMLNPPTDYATLTDTDKEKYWTEYKLLPNLPRLPRNTHVIIDVTIANGKFDCAVTLLPYTGVYLKPIFGL